MNDLSPMCLAKLVCLKKEQNKVVGFHFVGPNAGEITQGFHLALKVTCPSHPPTHSQPTVAHSNRLLFLHPTHPPTHPTQTAGCEEGGL